MRRPFCSGGYPNPTAGAKRRRAVKTHQPNEGRRHITFSPAGKNIVKAVAAPPAEMKPKLWFQEKEAIVCAPLDFVLKSGVAAEIQVELQMTLVGLCALPPAAAAAGPVPRRCVLEGVQCASFQQAIGGKWMCLGSAPCAPGALSPVNVVLPAGRYVFRARYGGLQVFCEAQEPRMQLV